MISYFTLYKPLFMLELLAAEYLFTCRLKRRPRYWLRLALAALACLAVSAVPWQPKAPLPMAVVFLLLFALTLAAQAFCYDVPVGSLLFCVLAGYNTQHFAHCAATVIRLLLNPKDSIFALYSEQILEAGDLPPDQFLSGAVLFFVVYLTYYAFYHLFAARIRRGQTPVLRSRSLLWVSLLSVAVSVLVNVFVMFSNTTAQLTMVISIYNAACCLFILFMLFSLMDRRQMADELEKIHALLDQSREQYAQSRRNIELINIKCHDLKHQIRTIGEANRINESALREMSEVINIYDTGVETGNPVLDTILTEKSLYCYKNHISLKCMADGRLLGFMTEAEIYSLFGNALDNAIRAVQNISDENRRVIGLNVCRVRQFVTIRVNNCYETLLSFSESGLPLTTKQDKDNHGLGLKSIRFIAEKYHGTISVHPEGDMFNLNIMIPLESVS